MYRSEKSDLHKEKSIRDGISKQKKFLLFFLTDLIENRLFKKIIAAL